MISKRITVRGIGDTIPQKATVTLTYQTFIGFTVAVTPGSINVDVGPGFGQARARFIADISCKEGTEGATGAIWWFATISAPENSNPDNDTLEGRTDVSCR